MKPNWKMKQDLAESKLVAEMIICTLCDAGFIDDSSLTDALGFGNGKITDIIYARDDEVRAHCKSVYKQAGLDAMENAEP